MTSHKNARQRVLWGAVACLIGIAAILLTDKQFWSTAGFGLMAFGAVSVAVGLFGLYSSRNNRNS
ncbi:hypothetical protein ACIA49_27275 [Kribbella sp. NPDC051587]|uniref:hypothetical protein n=1 Tax=Kribbella sp. NPDC051587 TaxID=3364119 RepID=UPI0037B40725